MLIKQEFIRRILVILIAHMGDTVLATPLTRALQAAYPEAVIDMLVSPLGAEAARHDPCISKVFVYEKIDWRRDRHKLMRVVGLLQYRKYDMSFATSYGSLGSMMAWFTGAKYRVGFDLYNGARFLTHVVSYPTGIIHEAEKQLKLLNPLGITFTGSNLSFTVSENEIASLHQKIKISHDRPIVAICPLSTHIHKNWTIVGWATVLKELSKLAYCYLIGSPKELPEITQINACSNNAAVIAAGSLTLGESAALLKEADLFITVDTGPLHIVQAFETPVLALFGPTHPDVWGPRRSCDVVIRSTVDCLACWHSKAPYWTYTCENHICMEQILPAKVVQTAQSMLEYKNGHEPR